MSSSIPKFQTLITIEEFRRLVNKYFEDKISQGELYDLRDIQRFNEVDGYNLMFIQHGQFGPTFNLDFAIKAFDGAIRWRKRHNVYDISTNEFPSSYFDRHVIYFKNQDKFNNRILHFVVRALNVGHENNQAIKRFITYHFEQHIREYPNQKIVILFDLSQTGLRHLDYDLIKYIIASGEIFYPGLIAYMLIYNMSFLLSAAWTLISAWIAPEAKQFVKFADIKSIKEYISPDQLSTRMGGMANDG